MSSRATFIDVVSIIDVSIDPMDNFLLALAKDGKASYLLTGDKNLLLKSFEDTKILTIAKYLVE